MALVWSNCRKFNADGSDIVAAADSSEAAFLQRWQAAGAWDTCGVVVGLGRMLAALDMQTVGTDNDLPGACDLQLQPCCPSDNETEPLLLLSLQCHSHACVPACCLVIIAAASLIHQSSITDTCA